jgi:hypothetical protein
VKAAENFELKEQAAKGSFQSAAGFDAPEPGTYIIAPAGSPPARVYRLRVPFAIPTGGTAEAIEVDPDETTLAATFAHLTYDALDPPHPALEAGLDTQDGAKVIMLDGPRKIRRVRLTTDVEVALHRLDGDNPVDDPSVTAFTGAVLEEFTDRRFAVRPANVEAVVVRSFATGPRVGISARNGEPTFFWRADGEIGKPAAAGDPAASPPASAGVVTDGTGLAGELQRLVDSIPQPLPAQVELDLVFESDAPCRVLGVSYEIDYRVVTRSFGLPAYGRGDVKDGAALARALREERDPVSHHVHGLLTAAGRKLVESPEPNEDALVAELNALVGGPSVYDAEAFAQVELPPATRAAAEAGAAGEALARLNRTLLDTAFPEQLAAPGENRVLRFAGNRAETRELAIRLPAGATVVEATLETIESIGTDRPTAGGGTTVGQAPTDSGVRLDPETTVAARTELDATLAATGLGLLLVPTTEKAELLAELREDHSGEPKGRKLAETTVVVEGLGSRTWATARFAAPIALQAQTHWVVLAARSGGAVWLAEPAGGEVHVLERSGEAPRDTIRGVVPIHRILSRSNELVAEPAVAVTIAGEPATTTADDESRTYGLTAALNAYLANQGGSGIVSIPLTIATASEGSVSVNPPQVVYDLD